MGETVRRLIDATGFRPRVLNVGGGYSREREPENVGGPLMNPVTIEEYAVIVTEELRSRLEPLLPELGRPPRLRWRRRLPPPPARPRDAEPFL